MIGEEIGGGIGFAEPGDNTNYDRPVIEMAGYVAGQSGPRSDIPPMNFKMVAGTSVYLLITVADLDADLHDATEIKMVFVPAPADPCGSYCATTSLEKSLTLGIEVIEDDQIKVAVDAADTEELLGDYNFDIQFIIDGIVYAVRRRDLKLGIARILQNLFLCE